MGHLESVVPRLLRLPWLDALLARLVEPADTETGWRHLRAIRWLVLLDIAMLAAVVYDAPYFQVSHVLVNGADVAEVAPYLPVDGLRGKNALTVDVEPVVQQVERSPVVKHATVERRFPNRLVVSIEAREPVVVWDTPEGKFQVDAEGVIVRSGGSDQLPVIYAPSGAGLKPGARVDGGTAALAAKLVPALANVSDWQAVRYDATPGGVTVTTNEGWRVTFGPTDDLEYKLELLRGILQVAKEREDKIEVVDLRSDVRPYYRPVGAATEVAPTPAATPTSGQ